MITYKILFLTEDFFFLTGGPFTETDELEKKENFFWAMI